MPKLPHENNSRLNETIEAFMPELVHSATPMLIVGVQRKVNTGNFENVDIYAGLSIPITTSSEDMEKFREAVVEAADLGFNLVSKETADRYQLVKEMQRGRQPSK